MLGRDEFRGIMVSTNLLLYHHCLSPESLERLLYILIRPSLKNRTQRTDVY